MLMSTASICDQCGTPVVFQVHSQRDDPGLDSTQREGVGVCPSCGAGYYLRIARTREPRRPGKTRTRQPQRDSQPVTNDKEETT